MNRRQKKKLKSDMTHEIYVAENNEMIFKKLIYNPLLRVLGMLILLIFSAFNFNRITKLAALTSNAIFSSEHVLGHITYFSILGGTIGICLFVSFFSIIFKAKADLSNIVTLRKAYQIYTVYDFVVFVLSTFVCLFFIIMILITPCNISGESMENTFHDGDRVLLWNIGYEPKDGDVIVFDSAKYTQNSSQETRFYIKRIVAKENDIIEYVPSKVNSGGLYVNNSYVESVTLGQYTMILNSIQMELTLGRVTVPKNKILVFGDNRGNSSDSRVLGFIDESEVIGKVLFRFYPFNKIGNPNQNNK